MILFVYIESLVKMIDNILMEVVEKNPFNSWDTECTMYNVFYLHCTSINLTRPCLIFFCPWYYDENCCIYFCYFINIRSKIIYWPPRFPRWSKAITFHYATLWEFVAKALNIYVFIYDFVFLPQRYLFYLNYMKTIVKITDRWNWKKYVYFV